SANLRAGRPAGKTTPSTPGLPGRPPAGHAWLYRRGEWSHAPDPLAPHLDGDGDGDLGALMTAAGFYHMADDGDEFAPVWLAHYAAEADAERHLVLAYACDRSVHVLVEDAPSLLMLLAELLPVVEAAGRLQAAQWREDERRRARKRGPTVYNARERCMEYA